MDPLSKLQSDERDRRPSGLSLIRVNACEFILGFGTTAAARQLIARTELAVSL